MKDRTVVAMRYCSELILAIDAMYSNNSTVDVNNFRRFVLPFTLQEQLCIYLMRGRHRVVQCTVRSANLEM